MHEESSQNLNPYSNNFSNNWNFLFAYIYTIFDIKSIKQSSIYRFRMKMERIKK